MLRAEQVISDIRSSYIKRTAENWRGHERQFVIEMVRGLDEAAFAFRMAPNRAELLEHDVDRHEMLRGSASALRPFLERLRDEPGGVPWGPSTPEWAAAADQHLMNCGVFAQLQRFAALERYGLAEATFRADDHLVLEIGADTDDAAELRASTWLRNSTRKRMAPIVQRLASVKDIVANRIDRYVDVHDGWFIRYDSDEELSGYHSDYAVVTAMGTAESEALPPDAVLGDRSFENWNSSSVGAYGRVVHHIAFATRLLAKTQGLELRNLLTIFSRKEDIIAGWLKAGESQDRAGRIIAGLTLDGSSAALCERNHEIPLPYYIDLGRDFVLLPIFGGLMNPCAGLVWHLKREYRRDWDAAVDGREAVFRNDLRTALPSRRYSVPDRGFSLRRPDGTELTDVDAVIIDERTGEIVLVQLKWPDIYGRSLAERNSRRINLVKANEWVGRVSDWVGGRSSAEVAGAFGLKASGKEAPRLLVLARHIAKFTGETGYDPRALWVSWPSLARMCERFPHRSVLKMLDEAEDERVGGRSRWSGTTTRRLLNLTVEIRCS